MVSPGGHPAGRTLAGRWATALLLLCGTTLLFDLVAPSMARAETVPVPLGAAADFAVLAGTTVTNTGGTTRITGDVGVSPGTAVTGLTPAQVTGSIHGGDAPAAQAQTALGVAYANAVSRTRTTTVPTALSGTLTTGIYGSASGTFGITGTVTLDAENNPDAVFVFQTATTLTTAADSAVNLINGAQSCNVFWQVGSSATLGAASTLRGNLLANTSITVGAGLVVDGRVLAINGAVTMDSDTITRSTCAAGALSITAPETAGLGSGAPGTAVSGSLGPVTVTDERGQSPADWIATVEATDFVTAGTPVRTVTRVNVSYWSGEITSSTGTGTFTSGQLTAQNAQTMELARTAFTLVDGAGVTSVTWNPVVSVQLPLNAIAGTYTGTVTISVA